MQAYLARQFHAALAALDAPDDFDASAVAIEFETPGNPEHGDLATNVALQLARPLRRAPRQIAEALVEHLALDPKRVAGVEIAGPGFINIRFAPTYLADGIAEILSTGEAYGRTEAGAGKTALVEYVSANPTGPLTVGHGRNAVLGDTIANLLDWTGYAVTREYYFNDAGRQMRILGESVRARVEALAQPDAPTKTLDDGTVVPESFPDDGYRGDYIVEIAQAILDEHGPGILAVEGAEPFKEAAEKAIFADIERTLERLGIRMDAFFNEHSLYASNAVWDVVEHLREKNLAYDKDGAVWFATGQLGKTRTDSEGERAVDTVLVKSSGEPTYRLPDIAYHLDKLGRGFDKVVDVFGADHIATYPDVVLGVEALGGDASKIDVLIYQFVTLVRGGQPVKMSTRKATYVTLDELMDEVTEDVTRFFFLMRSPNTHLEFDLDLAKEASDKNPVFYLQYAHARICSIIRKAEDVGLTLGNEADLSLLTNESELGLMKELLRLPSEIALAAETMGPHKLATYLREVATAFNQFYRDSPIIGADHEALGRARLHLAKAAQLVLRNGLTVLGISAPEQM
ncbi:MAG: arginine--tRNA ligase [Rhodothermaceae bacterium]|nr:arginine--tRNA ligase [Rhodothermaceae bacterium]